MAYVAVEIFLIIEHAWKSFKLKKQKIAKLLCFWKDLTKTNIEKGEAIQALKSIF